MCLTVCLCVLFQNPQQKVMTDQRLSVHHCSLPDTSSMATAEVTSLSIANGGGACAASAYQPRSADLGNKRMSIGSITFGLWELVSMLKYLDCIDKARLLQSSVRPVIWLCKSTVHFSVSDGINWCMSKFGLISY